MVKSKPTIHDLARQAAKVLAQTGALERDVSAWRLAPRPFVAVAAADPVGLARAARALADLEEVRPGGAAYVVVNRWRAGLGWSRDASARGAGRVRPEVRRKHQEHEQHEV